MAMQDVIRKRRRALGLTQEQVARELMVTGAAVSKWEQGLSCPDIALLPALARLLDTDVNDLLGFHREIGEREAAQMLQQVSDLAKAQGMEAAFERAQALAREYPRSGALLYGLAAVIEGSSMMDERPRQERERYAPVLETWYERAAQCADADVSARAQVMLAWRALNRGEMQQARRCMDMLPKGREADRAALEAELLRREGKLGQAAALLQRRLYAALGDVQNLLLKLAQAEAEEGNTQTAQALCSALAQMIEMFGLYPYSAHAAKLQAALLAREEPACLEAISGMLVSLEEPFSLSDPFFHRMEAKPFDGRRLIPGILRELRGSAEYDFLQGSAAFDALLAGWEDKTKSG